MSNSAKPAVDRYLYLLKTFVVIGATSFGGYMSLIAMLRNRMVVRDKTITDDLVAEGISLASMLPGPVAVNVVTYVGFCVAGVTGALLSLVAVLLPSFMLVLLLTMLYLHAGSTIGIDDILKGIFPVVAGIIFSTGFSMGTKIFREWRHYVIGIASFIVVFFFHTYWSIILVLIASALAGVLMFRPAVAVRAQNPRSWQGVTMWLGAFVVLLFAINQISSGTLLGDIFEQFSTVSLSLFGGGYVMVPILKSMLVDQLHWITDQDFVFGISIGQVTPGPILISATFFGYKMSGLTGAVVATVAIFAPSSILMLLLSAIFDSLKHSRLIQAALAGLKPGVVGLILYSGVSILLTHTDGAHAISTLLLTAISFWLVFRYNASNVLLILGGALAGYLLY